MLSFQMHLIYKEKAERHIERVFLITRLGSMVVVLTVLIQAQLHISITYDTRTNTCV